MQCHTNFSGKCYHIDETGYEYFEAQTECANMGGQLVSLETEQEWADLLDQIGDGIFWTGNIIYPRRIRILFVLNDAQVIHAYNIMCERSKA